MEGYKNNKATILYITHYTDLLGANRSLLSVATACLKTLKYEPLVIVPQVGPLVDEFKKVGISYIVIPIKTSAYLKKSYIDVIKAIIRELYNIIISIYASYKLRNEDIKAVHTNTSIINCGLYISKILRVKHIWHFREFAKLHFKWSYNLGEYLQYRIYKLSDYIVCVSDVLKSYYEKELKDKNISRIYNGVDIIPPNESCKACNWNICITGVVSRGKHQDVVLKALAKLINNEGYKNIKLYIIGNCPDENYIKELKLYIKNTEIEQNVIFCGYQRDVFPIMSLCGIGILASEYEAFGRATIEYMAMHLIPVVSNSGCNREIVTHKYNGLLFDLNDSESLSQAISWIYHHEQDAEKIREVAFESSKLYSEKECISNIMKLYDKVYEN